MATAIIMAIVLAAITARIILGALEDDTERSEEDDGKGV